jgi:tRNA-dihydrouridine synthase A
MREYAARELALGTRLHAITRHMLGLMSGRPGAREFRQLLSNDVQRGLGLTEVFNRAAVLACKPV